MNSWLFSRRMDMKHTLIKFPNSQKLSNTWFIIFPLRFPIWRRKQNLFSFLVLLPFKSWIRHWKFLVLLLLLCHQGICSLTSVDWGALLKKLWITWIMTYSQWLFLRRKLFPISTKLFQPSKKISLILRGISLNCVKVLLIWLLVFRRKSWLKFMRNSKIFIALSRMVFFQTSKKQQNYSKPSISSIHSVKKNYSSI